MILSHTKKIRTDSERKRISFEQSVKNIGYGPKEDMSQMDDVPFGP